MTAVLRLLPGLLAGGLLLVAGGGYLAWRHLPSVAAPAVQPGQPVLRSATLLNDSQPLPAFRLTTAGGELTNARLAGRWTLLYFGYTYCPDICPTALAALKAVAEGLVAAGGGLPQVIMVSVDPARDTPAQLARYAAFYDPAFIGATGPDEALAPLVKHLGVFYQRHDAARRPDYVVDHSDAVYLIDPDGRLKAVFSGPKDVAAMVADYRALTGAAGG
jgi:protein SCO1/2